MVAIPMALDRLRCMTVTLKELLRAAVTRPVILPMGAFVGLISILLRGTPDQLEVRLYASLCLFALTTEPYCSQDQPYFDPAQRLLQLALVAETFALGCDLLTSLGEWFAS